MSCELHVRKHLSMATTATAAGHFHAHHWRQLICSRCAPPSPSGYLIRIVTNAAKARPSTSGCLCLICPQKACRRNLGSVAGAWIPTHDSFCRRCRGEGRSFRQHDAGPVGREVRLRRGPAQDPALLRVHALRRPRSPEARMVSHSPDAHALIWSCDPRRHVPSPDAHQFSSDAAL